MIIIDSVNDISEEISDVGIPTEKGTRVDG